MGMALWGGIAIPGIAIPFIEDEADGAGGIVIPGMASVPGDWAGMLIPGIGGVAAVAGAVGLGAGIGIDIAPRSGLGGMGFGFVRWFGRAAAALCFGRVEL